jgi:hypothetical protein
VQAQKLDVEFMVKSKARKAARLGLRVALQHAAQQQLALKEKNKSPSSAMRISWAFDKLVWSMICDGESFAEAEINNMVCPHLSFLCFALVPKCVAGARNILDFPLTDD